MSHEFKIPSGTYMRIERKAGGVWASDKAFIRAAWSRLSAKGKTPEAKQFRRCLYDALLHTRNVMRRML